MLYWLLCQAKTCFMPSFLEISFEALELDWNLSKKSFILGATVEYEAMTNVNSLIAAAVHRTSELLLPPGTFPIDTMQ